MGKVMRERRQLSMDREVEAIQLRRQGLTYGEIAERLGYADHRGASLAVQRGMRRALQEPADELREIEAARLDRAMSKIWDQVEQGDLKAIGTMLRIMERRSKLLGLDAPTVIQQDVTLFDGSSDLDREVMRLAEILAGNGNTHSGSGETYLAIESSET
jgi:hypothetical protein